VFGPPLVAVAGPDLDVGVAELGEAAGRVAGQFRNDFDREDARASLS
jgi:hypothetical protein